MRLKIKQTYFAVSSSSESIPMYIQESQWIAYTDINLFITWIQE